MTLTPFEALTRAAEIAHTYRGVSDASGPIEDQIIALRDSLESAARQHQTNAPNPQESGSRSKPADAAPSTLLLELEAERRAHNITKQCLYDEQHGISAHTRETQSASVERTWLPMLTAPLDGSEIEILFRHHDYWTSLKLDGKEKAEEQWQAAQRAHWIDHNGGGWTWYGMAGVPVAWRPLDRRND